MTWIIFLTFTDWDSCRNYAAEHGIQKQDTYAMCMQYEEPPRQLAPETSLRPRARTDRKE